MEADIIASDVFELFQHIRCAARQFLETRRKITGHQHSNINFIFQSQQHFPGGF